MNIPGTIPSNLRCSTPNLRFRTVDLVCIGWQILFESKCVTLKIHSCKKLDFQAHFIFNRMSQQVLDMNLAKMTNNSWKFVYILAKQYRCPFNLTKFFTKMANFEFQKIEKVTVQKLVRTPCNIFNVFIAARAPYLNFSHSHFWCNFLNSYDSNAFLLGKGAEDNSIR